MIINERDNLIVTDNVLTNLPISLLSSIPAGVDGMGPGDLLLISRPCDQREMTDTGYMSYNVDLGSLSTWMYQALDINGITDELFDLRLSVDLLSEFYDMLCKIRDACPSAVVDIYDESNRFNPYVISAICTDAGTIISDLGGYGFSDAMSNIFGWRKFSKISAADGYFDRAHRTSLTATTVNGTNGVFTNLSATSRLSAANLTSTNTTTSRLTATKLTATDAANITNLTVDGQPYQHLSVMT